MSFKSWIALIIIVLITLVVSDWLFGLFFTWLGKMVLKYKERKRNKYTTVTQKMEDFTTVPVEELLNKVKE